MKLKENLKSFGRKLCLVGSATFGGLSAGCIGTGHPFYFSSFSEQILYKGETNPIVGTWEEYTSVSCDNEIIDSKNKFQELVFEPNNKFTFTWTPFETYIDYWGSYSYDANSGELKMKITGGNFVPVDADLEGKVTLQNGGRTSLEGIYFGSLANQSETLGAINKPCSYVISRTYSLSDLHLL